MNLFESDPKKMRDNLKASRRAAMEACPEPLKPYWAAVDGARQRAVLAITAKNLRLVHLRELERPPGGPIDAEARERWRAEIEAARRRLEEEEIRCGPVKEECRRAEKEYLRQLLEYRIRNVPEARRGDVRILLEVEKAAILVASKGSSMDGGDAGGAARTRPTS